MICKQATGLKHGACKACLTLAARNRRPLPPIPTAAVQACFPARGLHCLRQGAQQAHLLRALKLQALEGQQALVLVQRRKVGTCGVKGVVVVRGEGLQTSKGMKGQCLIESTVGSGWVGQGAAS